MRRLLTLGCATLLAACASVGSTSTTAPPSWAEARRTLAADLDPAGVEGALTVLDGIAADCRGFAPYHALRGELTLRLARQTRDAARPGAELLFQDAAAELNRSVELNGAPIAPRMALVEALCEGGQLDDGATAARALLDHLEARDDVDAQVLTAAKALRARAAARAFAATPSDDPKAAVLLSDARTSLRELEQQGLLDAALLALWSATEQRAGSTAEALDVYVRAAKRQPEDQAILNGLVEAAAALKQLPAALDALRTRSDATGLWYQGRLRYLTAEIERENKRTAEALSALDIAAQCFTASMQANPAYRDGCERWLAMCLGKRGNIAFLAADLPHAETWLLESTRLRPDCIGDDLGGGETTKLGLLRVGDRIMRDFEHAEAFYRAASALVDSDQDLLNNAAVFARDRGTQLEKSGKTEEAVAMFERSYAGYQRAVLLDPSSVRTRNDCALIAIHHLDRDWDLSRQMLDSAIVDGEKTLLDDPPADSKQRQALDEAVGDCYENLALWHLKHSKDAAAARAAALVSLDHYPRERRGGAKRHLQAADALLPAERPR
ncbi:MAG TPA: hypothetical protein VK843_15345 [Planctomycetota bacterium]|nr:hypothetical protein [Planctomycetota bacterium]